MHDAANQALGIMAPMVLRDARRAAVEVAAAAHREIADWLDAQCGCLGCGLRDAAAMVRDRADEIERSAH